MPRKVHEIITVGYYKPRTNQAIPTSRSEVCYVYHATHFEFALDMIKDIKLDSDGRWRCQVEFETSPSQQAHNEKLSPGKHLLFFGCELGEGWNKGVSRYGNIMFKFLLSDLLEAFAKVSSAKRGFLKYHAMGSTMYKQEHVDKVLVTAKNCEDVPKDFPILKSFKQSNEFLPLSYDLDGNWSQVITSQLDQREFVLMFNNTPGILLVSGEMEFYSHDFCVPVRGFSSRTPKHCGTWELNIQCTNRADADAAKAEFAAAVFCEGKMELLAPVYNEYKSLLDARQNRLTDDPRCREYVKFHYTSRYFIEEQHLKPCSTLMNADEGSVAGSHQNDEVLAAEEPPQIKEASNVESVAFQPPPKCLDAQQVECYGLELQAQIADVPKVESFGFEPQPLKINAQNAGGISFQSPPRTVDAPKIESPSAESQPQVVDQTNVGDLTFELKAQIADAPKVESLVSEPPPQVIDPPKVGSFFETNSLTTDARKVGSIALDPPPLIIDAPNVESLASTPQPRARDAQNVGSYVFEAPAPIMDAPEVDSIPNELQAQNTDEKDGESLASKPPMQVPDGPKAESFAYDL